MFRTRSTGRSGVAGGGSGGKRKCAVVERESGDESFKRGRSAERVAVEALGGEERDTCQAGAEDELERGGFGGVVGAGGGAVGADAGDLLAEGLRVAGLGWFSGLRAGTGEGLGPIVERSDDGLGCAFGAGLGDVVSVGGHAEAEDFGVNGGVAGAGGGEGFERQQGGSLGEGHAVAVSGKGSADRRGDDAHGVPGTQEAAGQRGFMGAGERGRDQPGADHLESEADGVGSRRAGGGDGERGAGDVVIHGDLREAGRGHGSGDGEWMDTGVVGVDAADLWLFGVTAVGGAAED